MLKSDFVNAAAEMFCIHPRDLVGPYRYQFLLPARFALSKALRLRGWTLPAIGRLVNRDHTTIIYQIERADYYMERDAGFAAKIQALVDLNNDEEQLLEAAA